MTCPATECEARLTAARAVLADFIRCDAGERGLKPTRPAVASLSSALIGLPHLTGSQKAPGW